MIEAPERTADEIRCDFIAQLLNLMTGRMHATLHLPLVVSAVMRSGRDITMDVPLNGGEVFRITGATRVPVKNRLIPAVMLRLEPIVREEFRYITVDMENTLSFTFAFDSSEEGNFPFAFEHCLDVMDTKLGRPYRDILNAAVALEQARVHKLNIASHPEFGSW